MVAFEFTRLIRSGLMVVIACVIQFVALGASGDPSENWPQWRGPHQNGLAPKANPPVEWSETKNVKWKVKLPGEGHSTPIVWGDKIFVLAAIPTGKRVEPNPPVAAEQTPAPGQTPGAPAAGPGGTRSGGPGRGRRGGGFGGAPPTEVFQFAVLCLDRSNGQVLWQKVAREELPHEGKHANDGSFASPSPVTDGQHLYAWFGSRGLYCYDFDGNLKWSQDLGDMRIALSFGEGSSPALYRDRLIVQWDHEGESFVAALDKTTGNTLWKQPRQERTSWSTPLVLEHEGKTQVITAATGKIRSYDFATGSVIWECAGLTQNVIPSPVAGHGMVYLMSGFRGNALLAIRLGRTGDLTGTDAIVWKHDRATPYVPSPLLYTDKLYFFSSNNGILSSFNALTGKPNFVEQRLEGLSGVYASPAGAAERVYIIGRNGAAMVLKASDTFEIIASNKLEDRFEASPALVGKEIFLRGREHLYCIAEP